MYRAALIVVAALSGRALADTPPVAAPSVHAHAARAPSGITVDGHLDDAAWQTAPRLGHFTQRFPKDGAPATFPTEFAVLYDDKAIYVAAWCTDPEPAQIRDLLTRRDLDAPADSVMVGIDSYHDRRTAFVFQLNAAGVQRDMLLYDDQNQDDTWDAVWTGAAVKTETGWTAEFRIPLSQLRFTSNEEGHEWGLQVQRNVGRTSEQSTWSPWPRSSPSIVGNFGTVDGIAGLKPSRRLELLPYITGGGNRSPVDAGDPVNAHFGHRIDAGADLKYGLGPAFTLSATINPDFGQVEADPSTINLSANELFFAEKRPFFLEGTELFRLPIGVGDNNIEGAFYSRRIGAQPADPSNDFDYIHKPASTTIYTAAKLTGKQAGWSIGMFDAVTGQESGDIALDGQTKGEAQHLVLAPLTNYAMARVKRDFRNGQSSIGAVATAVDRDLSDPGLAAILHDQAYTGGLTFSHRFWNNAWSADLTLLGSYVHGSEDAIANTQQLQRHLFQRPDATYLHFDPHRTSLTGLDVSSSIGQFGDAKHWRYGIANDLRTPGLELNDMGFQQNADRDLGFIWMQYRDDEPGDNLLNWQANHDIFWVGTTEPQLETLGYEFNANAQFLNYWNLGMYVSINKGYWDAGRLRGGPEIRQTDNQNGNINITTDTRKWLWFNFHAGYAHDATGQIDAGDIELGAQIQARSNLDIYVGPAWSARTDPLQYIDEVDDLDGKPHYIFGAIDQTTTSLTLRVNWTFSPRLALQIYAQPFVAAGRYDEIKDVDDPHAKVFADRFHTYAGRAFHEDDDNLYLGAPGANQLVVARPDFDFRQVRSTIVLRWEYRPGSNIYAIWSHGQTSSDEARFDLTHDVSLLARAAAEDIVMVKANYWIGL